MHPKSCAGRTQCGNILFLILLAVVLFAALSYAVTSAMRGGGKDGEGESASVQASMIIGELTRLENELMRWMLINIFTWNDIDINGSPQFYTTSGIWGLSACSSSLCDFSHPSGGNFSMSLPLSIRDLNNTHSWAGYPTVDQPVRMTIRAMNVDGIGGTSAAEPILKIYGVKKEICEKINERFGITNPNFCMTNNNITSDGTGGAVSCGYSNFSNNLKLSHIWCLNSAAGVATSGDIQFIMGVR